MTGTYSSARYQSKFKDSSQPVDDRILNNIILSKLNKFSTGTYNEIREFLYQILGSGEPDLTNMVRDFMRMVFKKAASEELYCSLYAKLLCEISSRYPVIIEEMHRLQGNYLSIFDDVEDGTHDSTVEKRFRQGYSQFIAELALLEIMELSYLEQTFTRIFDVITKLRGVPDKTEVLEEYVDCLLCMSRVFKKGATTTPFLTSARAKLLGISLPVLDDIVGKKGEYASISSKSRCILMDVKDNLLYT
jgi:dimeric dUTPase (all-alpha-NTP-PPase superfamily)